MLAPRMKLDLVHNGDWFWKSEEVFDATKFYVSFDVIEPLSSSSSSSGLVEENVQVRNSNVLGLSYSLQLFRFSATVNDQPRSKSS